jgi:hypothetical protein
VVPPRPDDVERPALRPLYRATAVVALLGVLATLVGVLSLLRPVETPTQDCGTSLAVLLQGRPNVFVDPNDPPPGVTAEEAVANNERPCRTRVAAAGQPGARLIAGGMVVALAAMLVEVIARTVARHRRHTALRRAEENGTAEGNDGEPAAAPVDGGMDGDDTGAQPT